MTLEDEENVYVDAQYTNREVILGQGCSTSQAPTVPARNAAGPNKTIGKSSYKKTWRIFAVVVGAITMALLATVVALVVTRETAVPMVTNEVGEPDTNTAGRCSTEKSEISCDELRKRGSATSGIYVLQPDENSFPIEVYCDMETDGGGWTLVASIHDSDIQRKCYSDDLWSSYVPGHQMTETGQNNWDNEMTFGTVYKCIEDDYKNLAYYSLNASDLMVWHVLLGFHVDHMRSRSTFRYRTTGKFLRKYGGNLKNLFDKYYRLEKNTADIPDDSILNTIVANSEQIKSQIPDWYNYAAGTGSSISDSSMFNSYGSQIHFRTSSRSYYYLNYGQKYRIDASLTSVKTSVSNSPFILIGTIQNEERGDSYYDLEVYSYSTYVSGYISIPELEGRITQGNYALQYKAVQHFDPSKNTPCEMFFVISNTKDWDSTEPSTFRRSNTYYRSSNRRTTYRIDGNPKKLIFGYILLAREIGRNFTTEHLNNVSSVILQVVSSDRDTFRASSIDNTLTVPISFDKGTADDMVNTIPPSYRSFVEAGYLQFRAYNYTGYPNAICPGIKVASNSPEYVCIGGVSGDIGKHGTCGDFAGWGGRSTDTVLSSQPSGSAHSHKDMLSTILLFYR